MYILKSECIYCGACVVECPEGAVVTSGSGREESSSGKLNIQYAINSDMCTECPDQDFPLCYSICPMNCIKINDERLE